MKAITLGLAAALAFSAAGAQAASLVTFTITAESSAGVLTPTSRSSYTIFDGGDKLNVSTVLHDTTYMDGNVRHIDHWADMTYDRQGGYRDTTYWVYESNPTQAANYIYFKATVTVNPNAGQTVPMTFKVSSDVSGTYSSVTDPRFPNVKPLPASLTFAYADSHDAADLAASSSGITLFDPNGTFVAFDSSDNKIIPAAGTTDFSGLLYMPAQLHASSYLLSLTGPLYDTGLYHFSQSAYLGYEIQAVPEPTTWAMLLAGVGILGVARRRKTAA